MVESKKVNEAFLNEFKGAIFEFLVAHGIAKHYALEADFYSSISPSILEILGEYELELQSTTSPISKRLFSLSEQTTKEILSYFSEPLERVSLLAKGEEVKRSESDILLKTQKGSSLGISLKLCKEAGTINTKSAGVKSVLKKYFAWVPNIGNYQYEFNRYIEQSFFQMSQALYHFYDLDFNGGFDQQWQEAGLPDRPGELSIEANNLVKSHYYRVSSKLNEFFLSFYDLSKEQFLNSMMVFLGFSSKDLVQIQCLYRSEYEFSRVKIIDYDRLFLSMENINFSDQDNSKSFFSLLLGDFKLQVRVKPMNKFTVEGLKVNFGLMESHE